MISLKKYLDADADTLSDYLSDADPGELLPAVLEAYRSALLVMGHSALRAYPAVGSELQQNLAKVVSCLAHDLTPVLIQETGAHVEGLLGSWGGKTEEYFKAKTNDIKELLIVLARTAESVGERDQRYSNRFTQFTSSLQAIADLENLTQVRASLVRKAAELKACIEQMETDSHQSLAQLHAEVSNYQDKLKAPEELALRDPLTGLANRRNIEERIAWRIAHQQPFCVAMIDLERFKHVNDHYGHQAGDNLLQQFSQELCANMRSGDLVGRWGGDEFIVLLDCEVAGAVSQISRMREWVTGDYTVQLASGAAAKVRVDASIGVAQWRPDENTQQVIERADSAMYKEKNLAKQRAADQN
jgi:diguanylate cyclase (GGDEF)-like protein